MLSSLLGTATHAAQPVDIALPVDRAIAAAEEALQRGEPEIAESRYRTALLEGWLLMGSVSAINGEMESAVQAFESAQTVAVETRRARLSLAAIRILQDDADEAIRLLRSITGKDVLDLEARRLVAQALSAQGQIDESVQELEELRILFPQELETLFLLGAASLRQGEIARAEAAFAELAASKPLPQTHVLIGRTWRDFEQWDQARAALGKALELDPQTRRAHYYLGTVEVFELAQKGLADAMAHFEAELLLAPEDPGSNLYLGMALVEERREEEAISRLEAASRNPGSERDALQYLGRAYLRVGRTEEAVTALERSLALATASPTGGSQGSLLDRRLSQISQLHYQLGLAYRRLGDEESAAFHFDAAEESKAVETEDSRERLRQFLENEAGNRPLQLFASPLDNPAIEALPLAERRELQRTLIERLAQAYVNLGVLKTRGERLSEAADLFEQAVELAPGFTQAQYSLGVARFSSGQFEAAIAPLSRALESDPGNGQLRRMLALAWFNVRDYGKAAELLETDPLRATDRSIQYTYGIALVRSGRGGEAEEIFAELLTQHPDWPELNVVLGQAFAQQDAFESAIEVLRQAITARANVPEAHATLGEIYMRQGELDKAEQELRTELDYFPDDLRTRFILATVLDLAGQPDEALEVLESILESSPRAANARYLKGKILLAQGEAEQAQVQLEAASRLSPEDPETHYQLGLALQRLGRVDEARSAFDTYQRLKRDQRPEEPH